MWSGGGRDQIVGVALGRIRNSLRKICQYLRQGEVQGGFAGSVSDSALCAHVGTAACR